MVKIRDNNDIGRETDRFTDEPVRLDDTDKAIGALVKFVEIKVIQKRTCPSQLHVKPLYVVRCRGYQQQCHFQNMTT